MKRGQIRRILPFFLLLSGLPLISTSTAAALPAVLNFSYTGAAQSWTVPSGITSIQFRVIGATGGTSYGNRGGYGESITGTLNVTPGETLSLYVGKQGSGHSGGSNPAAFNGGGAGFNFAAGGGGASDMRQGGNLLSNRVVVSGGGGGGTNDITGGNAGFTSGEKGADASGGAGLYGIGGGGGTQSAGGAGGAGASMCGNAAGGTGALGVGGTGGQASSGGAGGGGGFYGGGGGGSGCNASAGGGGSSYINSSVVTSYAYSLNSTISNGSIQISYAVTTPATVSLSVNGGNAVIYRTTVTLNVSVSSAGKVTFLANGKRISNCISKAVSTSFSCSWKPSQRGSVRLQVLYINTSGTEVNNNSSIINVTVDNRATKR